MTAALTFRTLAIHTAVVLLSFLAVDSALGQGKITGRVTDADTGEPLIGVNAVVDGTTQGATTDVDGNYVILNVRPGEHTLVFSYIGFGRQFVEGVQVTSDHTTRIDVEMGEEVIEGEEIIVQADRPLVQKDLTSSSKTFVAEEIDQLPVEGFLGVLATQAGVSQDAEGQFHIRGGRTNEISYLVDGMSVGNPFNTNGLATEVAADAIQEMTVISGAFNAEYGKAMSGIVNLVTKEGGSQLEGSASFYAGDAVGGNNGVFKDPNELEPSVYTMEGSLSGPLFTNKLRFFLSGRHDVDDGHIFGVREHLPSDSANFNPDPARLETIREFIPGYEGPNWYYEMHGKPWYEYVAEDTPIPNEVVALNPRESFNLLGKITFRPFSGAKIEYSHLQDGSKRRRYDFDYRYVPDGTTWIRDRSFNHSLHWTHSLGDRSFYTTKFSYAKNSFREHLFEDPRNPNYVVDRGETGNGNLTGFPGTNFLFAGNQKSHVYEDAQSFRAKLDATRQFGLIHEAKAGLDMQLHWLDRQNFTVLYDGNRYREPTVEPPTSPSHDLYKGQRVNEFAAYAQDKLEFTDFIINAGLRYERFEPNGVYIPNLREPRGGREIAKVRNMVLPRVGVSFPITAEGIIHFSYGHFAQMPSLRNLYLNPEFEFPFDEVPTFGNTNLRPERTVQYEIGLQQQLTEVLAFDVTAYFKDIRDYLTRQQIQYSTIPGQNIYNIYVNKNYANVKGVSFALTMRRPREGLVSANVDYTYQIAEGDNDDPSAAFFNFLSGRETDLEVIPLDFDQRHIISSTVTISDPASWGISLIGRYTTGYPYSPVLLDQNIDELPRSGRKPAQIKLDAHLYKNVQFGAAQFRVFAKIFNALDVMNENYVFDDTGRATYSLSDERNLHATWEPGYGLPGVHGLDEWDTRPHYFSSPREVRLGVTLGF